MKSCYEAVISKMRRRIKSGKKRFIVFKKVIIKILLDAGAHVNPILRTSKNVFMTPLDCALQRGFRSTAKYLQLHGGVPANRLASAQRNQQPNSALNFQIRDDVTFWGDTSSDTDRENKSGKRTVRKKISHKREKKKESVSDSDVEAPPLQNNKSDSAGSRTKRKTKEESGEKNISAKINNQQSAAPSSIRNSSRKLPTSRIDYTNEIIINGKTEINIHHTNEIIIDREPATMDQVNETIIPSEVPDTNRRIASAKGRRPRSAKYSKGKSARSSAENRNIPAVTAAEITSPETAIQQEAKETEMRKEHSLKDQSTNTSEETMVTVIENKNAKAISEDDSLRIDDTAVVGSKNLPDQQSLMSNTSEDVESHKDLIVEASIHAPPKSAEAKLEKSDEPKVTETDAKECEAATVEPTLETEAEVTSSGKEAEPPTQNQENNKLLQEDKLNEGILLKEIDSNKTDVAANGASVITDDHKNISEQELYDKLDESERKGSRDVSTGVNDAIKDPSVSNRKVLTTKKSPDKNGDVVETTQSVKSEHEVQEESPKVENEEMTNKTRADESVGKDNEESEEKKENIEVNEAQGDQDNFNLQENKALLTTGTASEEKETENIGTPPESPTKKSGEKGETVDDEAESIQKGKEALSKEENVESSAAKIEATVDKIKGGQSNATAETRHEKSSDGKIPKKAAVEPEKIRNKKSVVVTNKTKVKGAEEIRKKKQIKDDRQKEEDEHEEYSEDFSSEDSSVSTTTKKTHKSFRVLDEREAAEIDKSGKNKPKRSRTKNSARKGSRSRSTENKAKKEDVKERGFRRSKIPTPLVKTVLSKSDKHLDKAHKTERKSQSTLDTRVPSLPNIHQGRCALKEPPRPESNMSAPLLTSVYSDNERDSMSDVEDGPRRSKKRVKKRPRTREARSAGSDYESSNLIDSGFEPSPRSTRIPRWKNMSERAVNMTSVTQSIQNNIRRYHLERKIFQHLLELKRLQIRAGQHNEAVLVKRAIDAYHQSCASTVGAGKYIPEDFSFKSFERFLYESLRKLQKTDVEYMKGLPEASTNPLLCTRSTNRCMHATHAYTGIPCAAYLPKMDHHTIPKIGFNDVSCKPGTGFLPNINSKKAVTLELSHGSDKQVISLPADRLDQNKRYYVTFTVKGNESSPSNGEDGPNGRTAHRHSKSD
ncbi:hypothetical protein NQ318_018741 [Aromia moschata]|uniref:Uncharacterized protein n=1 Tax=Aromia moschata TaxID=1265417 RepID=A0AAV8ZIV0_9CUCU|nr:hypothetical protein NQ318_018741 [Aromia moschata]